MLWNALNDPLLGWISDTTSCHEQAVRALRRITVVSVSLACSIVDFVLRLMSARLADKVASIFCTQPQGAAGGSLAPHLNRRVDMICFGGLLWCASFLLLWWPWAYLPAPGNPGDATVESWIGRQPRWLASLVAGLHFTSVLCKHTIARCISSRRNIALLCSFALHLRRFSDVHGGQPFGTACRAHSRPGAPCGHSLPLKHKTLALPF